MLGNAFKEKSLDTRIMFAFFTMGGMVLIVTLIGLASVLRLSSNIDAISRNSLPSQVGLWKVNEGQTQIESSERLLIVPNLSLQERQTEIARMNKAWDQIKDGFKQYEATPRDEEEDRTYKKLQESWDKWKKDHEEFLRLNQQFESLGILSPYSRQIELIHQGKDKSPDMENAQKAANLLDQLHNRAQANHNSFEAATQFLLDDIKINENGGIAADKDATHNINQSKYWSIILILLGPLAAILFGKYFSNTVAKPLDNLIRRIQQSGVQITTSTTQIAASGKELEATIAQQLASTNEVTSTSQEIAATSKSLVKTIEQVADMTQVTATAASKSQGELAQMDAVMRHLAEATNSISSKLGVMNKKASNINNVVLTITKVADQTSILSLNAAIEAEKAGEYGAGFAVVAREIRRLANQTAVATLEIEQIVKDIQSSVTAGVMEMDKFNKSVSDSVERIDKISDQVAAVIQQVQSLPPQFSQVSQSVDEQAQGAQQISESMQQLSEASHQTVDALRDTNGALEQLNDAAQGLRAELSHFK